MQPKVKIAIIDNGVNDILLHNPTEYNMFVNVQGICQNDLKNMDNQNFQHGTNCAMIIEKFCKECILSSIRILDDNGKGLIEHLRPALEWCYKEGIKLVNLSLGTTHFADKDKIQIVVNEYANKGIVIVAASSNNGYTTYPASFTNVIGVIAETTFQYNKIAKYQKGIDFEAPSNHEFTVEGVSLQIGNSNSYAAPVVTALAGNIFFYEGYMKIGELKKKICKQCTNWNKKNELLPIPDWITTAWLADYEKQSSAKYYFHTVEEQDEFCKDQIDTIILKSNKEFERVCKSNKNIVYLGKESVDTSSVKYFMWSREERIRQIYQVEEIKRSLTLPIILCGMEYNIDEFKWLCKFQRRFCEDGFNAYTISFEEESVLYGLEYIPVEFLDIGKSEKLHNFLYWQTFYKQSDVIVIGVVNTDIEKVKEIFSAMDIVVGIKSIENSNKVDIWSNDEIKSNRIYDKIDNKTIQEIYLNVIQLLTEDDNEQ